MIRSTRVTRPQRPSCLLWSALAFWALWAPCSAHAASGTHIAPGFTGNEFQASAIPDGEGGAFVAFQSYPAQWTTVFVRLGPDGVAHPSWPPVSVPSLNRYYDDFPTACAMSSPGWFWLFSDLSSVGDMFFRRVTPSGLSLVEGSGVAERIQLLNRAVPMSDGRTFVQGLTSTAGAAAALRVGILDTDGVFDASLPDVALPGGLPFSGDQFHSAIPDGLGGILSAVDVKEIGTGSGADLVAARFGPDGHALWSPPGRVLVQAVRAQSRASLCSDGAGGGFFAWDDPRDLTHSSEVYAAHLLADGSRASGWAVSGNPVAAGPGDQFQVRVAEDGRGGAWLVWTDSRSGVNDIYYTRIGSDGSAAAGFPANGIPLCSAPGSQIEPAILADGEGGFYCVWLDERDGELDLFGQHIHYTGVVMPGWDSNGLSLCDDPTPQQEPMLLLLSPQHPIAIWRDTRNVVTQYMSMALPGDGPVADVSSPRGARLVLAPIAPGRELEFRLSTALEGDVEVSLFDVHGRRLARQVVSGPTQAHAVKFAGHKLPAGVYLARAVQGSALVTARAVQLR